MKSRVQQQKVLFLFFVFLQLNSTLQSETINSAHETNQSDMDSPLQGRFLIVAQRVSTSCTAEECTASSSLVGQNSIVFDVNLLGANSQITLDILVGTPKIKFSLLMTTQPSVQIVTDIKLNPSSQWPNNIIDTYYSSNYQRNITISSSSESTRLMKVILKNRDPLVSSRVQLKIDVLESAEDEQNPWLIPVIAAGVGFVILFGICYICGRIRRNRRLKKQREAHIAQNQARANQQLQQQQQAQQALSDFYLQPHHYAPVMPQSNQNRNLSQNRNQNQNQNQPQNQDPDHSIVLNIHDILSDVPAGDALDPLEGPLAEWNFDFRFPEGNLQSFKSSFSQKICSICLSEMTNQRCRQLYCEHIFHSSCAEQWLLNQISKQGNCCCPNCSKDVTTIQSGNGQ